MQHVTKGGCTCMVSCCNAREGCISRLVTGAHTSAQCPCRQCGQSPPSSVASPHSSGKKMCTPSISTRSAWCLGAVTNVQLTEKRNINGHRGPTGTCIRPTDSNVMGVPCFPRAAHLCCCRGKPGLLPMSHQQAFQRLRGLLLRASSTSGCALKDERASRGIGCYTLQGLEGVMN